MRPAAATRLAQRRMRNLLLDGISSKTSSPTRGVNRTIDSMCDGMVLALRPVDVALPYQVVAIVEPARKAGRTAGRKAVAVTVFQRSCPKRKTVVVPVPCGWTEEAGVDTGRRPGGLPHL